MMSLDETAFCVTSPRTTQEAVIVGPANEKVVAVLEALNMEVHYCDKGFDYLERDPLFVFSDFLTMSRMNLTTMAKETAQRDGREGRTPHIAGPPYILHHYKTQRTIPFPPRNRPRFCCLMDGIHVTMDIKDISLKKELIDKFHWMGGSVRKDVGDHMTHFIGNTVASETCRHSSGLGKPLLRPSWISEAWNHNSDLSFNPLAKNFIKLHSLECFEGLKIYFTGLISEQVNEMTKVAKSKLAEIVDDPKLASHIVYGTYSENLETIPDEVRAWHVTDLWFWKSIELGKALFENDYTPSIKKLARQVTPMSIRSKSSMMNDSNSSMISNGDKSAGSPCKTDKKQMIVTEMLQTETNYLEALQLLIDMKQKLVGTKEGDTDSWIAKNPNGNVTVADANMIFGKLVPIIKAHKKLQKDLHAIISNWTSKSGIGPTWHTHMDELAKVYPPFINTYDMAKQHFMELDKDEHFHAFVRACEADEKWRRQRVMDVLVRPVQRLPQIFLLLEQCAKYSKKGSHDAESLSIACRKGQEILKNANESRRATEAYEKNCRIFDEIESMPPELRSSQRLLNSECVVVCLGGSGDWQHFLRKPLRLIIFNDVFMIAKRRAPPTGTISRMARHFSTTSLLGDRRKPYKFISYYFFNSGVRQIKALNDASMDNNRLFMMTLRHNEKGDEEVLIGVDEYYGHDPTSVSNCMAQLEKNVFLETGRENLIQRVTLHKLPQTYSEDLVGSSSSNLLDDSKENLSSANSSAVVNCAGMRRGFTLRKALSNTSILRRFHTHPLREQQSPSILEESTFTPSLVESQQSFSTPTVIPESPVFASPKGSPRKGLGKMQSASNFFARTIRKPSFRKGDSAKTAESEGKYTQL